MGIIGFVMAFLFCLKSIRGLDGSIGYGRHCIGAKHWLDGSIGRTVYLEWKVLHFFLSGFGAL